MVARLSNIPEVLSSYHAGFDLIEELKMTATGHLWSLTRIDTIQLWGKQVTIVPLLMAQPRRKQQKHRQDKLTDNFFKAIAESKVCLRLTGLRMQESGHRRVVENTSSSSPATVLKSIPRIWSTSVQTTPSPSTPSSCPYVKQQQPLRSAQHHHLQRS